MRRLIDNSIVLEISTLLKKVQIGTFCPVIGTLEKRDSQAGYLHVQEP